MCHFPTIIVHFFPGLHPKEGWALKLQAVSPFKIVNIVKCLIFISFLSFASFDLSKCYKCSKWMMMINKSSSYIRKSAQCHAVPLYCF